MKDSKVRGQIIESAAYWHAQARNSSLPDMKDRYEAMASAVIYLGHELGLLSYEFVSDYIRRIDEQDT